MKLFDIFDQLGNKIGEVHEADNSLDGGGLSVTAGLGYWVIAGAMEENEM